MMMPSTSISVSSSFLVGTANTTGDEVVVPPVPSSSNSAVLAAQAAPAAVVSDDDEECSNHHLPPPTPLRFEFRGYSVWLELEHVDNNDLHRALDVAATDLHVHRVPYPHVTVEYGMTHLSEQEMRQRFRNDLPTEQLLDDWPALAVKGIQTGSTYDGVDGEDMTMAWVELTLGTSPKHEHMVDMVRRVFYRDEYRPRHEKWKPHLSLCYENPEQAKSNLHYSLTILHRVPTLTKLAERRITGISLWKTEGTMENWQCLERSVRSLGE